ncbi:MAG TPA: hypothetical protein VFD24_08720 [Chitinophagaceae bacterium]|nr:hypothetical protein [Chitinophagaceae bacterium]
MNIVPYTLLAKNVGVMTAEGLYAIKGGMSCFHSFMTNIIMAMNGNHIVLTGKF